MSDVATLQGLRARVEAASGPDLELDADVVASLEGGEVVWKQTRYTGDQYPSIKRSSKNHINGFAFEYCPRVTSSIDACVGLVERLLSGWEIEVTIRSGASLAEITGPEFGDHDMRQYAQGSVRPTAPLAILSALLSALISREATDA